MYFFFLKTGCLYASCPRTHYVDQAGFKLLSVGFKDPALVGPFKRAASVSGEHHKRGQAIQGEKPRSQDLKVSFLVNVQVILLWDLSIFTFTLVYLAAFPTVVWCQFYFK